MLTRLLGALQGPVPVEIPDDLWARTISALPCCARLTHDERARLRALAARLLAEKQMAGAGGLVLEAAIQVNIAAQACLPVLNLGLHWYRGWSGIVVYPGRFAVPRHIADEDGVVHEITDELSGEAWSGGPVVLSWGDAADGGTAVPGAGNVVIHEFTHKIDMLEGSANGCPAFSRTSHPLLDPDDWRDALLDALERMDAELALIADELPDGVDPDSAAADPYYAHLPLDPYAATNEAEFFAVSSECFFVAPGPLRDAFPRWYALLAAFFRQDPLAAAPRAA